MRSRLRLKRLTVISPSMRATTIWPFSATLVRCTAIRSPSKMPSSIIESPFTLQQVIGRGQKHRAIEQQVALDIGVGADRRAGGDPAEDRQQQRRLAWPHPVAALQADAARLARQQGQVALGFQRQQVLVRAAGLVEAEGRGDFRQRGRQALRFDLGGDEIEDGLLAVGQVGHGYQYRYHRR